MGLPEEEQCGRCKQYFMESMMYDITTPNIEIKLCVDCAIEVEEDLMNLAYKTTTDDVVSESGKKYQDEELQYCYDKGLDNIKNGSNTTNSNYAIFSTKEKLKAWEHGRHDASSEVGE